MHKTQVFISPEGDHFRTRLTHTLEVTQIARTIARALRLNEDLAEAIALGHDLGHTPFGHTGEAALDALLPEGFRHNEQSLRVVKLLEKNGNGLNLTQEVTDGILNHRLGLSPSTLEGKVVQISDKIAYINHDIDDALRSNVLSAADLPPCSGILGNSSSKRINSLIRDVIAFSSNKPDVALSSGYSSALYELRSFMFEKVYESPPQTAALAKTRYMLEEIFGYYIRNTADLPLDYTALIEKGNSKERAICDYIAGMTDRFALKLYSRLFTPPDWMAEFLTPNT